MAGDDAQEEADAENAFFMAEAYQEDVDDLILEEQRQGDDAHEAYERFMAEQYQEEADALFKEWCEDNERDLLDPESKEDYLDYLVMQAELRDERRAEGFGRFDRRMW